MSALCSTIDKRSKSTPGRVNAAIIGFGSVAQNAHLPWYRQRSDVELVAVVEPTAAGRSLAQSLLPGVLLFDDVGALLRSVDVKFLDVASPPAAHAEVVLRAAKAGISIFCEKPFVTDWHSFKQIEQARLHRASVIACCHNWYFAPAIRRALMLIDSGQLGDVNCVYFEARRLQPAVGAQHWKPEWRKTSSNGGGIIADLGYHGMYLASRMFKSRPLAVKTDALVGDPICDEAEISASIQLEYGMNRRAELHLSWKDVVRHTKIHVTGSKACVSIENDTLRLYDATSLVSIEKFESVTADSWHAAWTAEGLNQFMKAFYERDGESCWCDISWSMSALSAAYASAKSGVIEAAFAPS